MNNQFSPPSFAWDEWYGSVGGRSINIDEVQRLLKEIHEDQYKRFESEVVVEKKVFANSIDASNAMIWLVFVKLNQAMCIEVKSSRKNLRLRSVKE
jgi:hypothetical protein